MWVVKGDSVTHVILNLICDKDLNSFLPLSRKTGLGGVFATVSIFVKNKTKSGCLLMCLTDQISNKFYVRPTLFNV